MSNIDDETRRRMYASTDRLFDQLKRCPIDCGELDRVIRGLDLANIEGVSAALGASELMLRDLEELADALLRYGLPADRIIEILANLNEQEIELQKFLKNVMTSAEQKDSDDIKLIGEVRWGFKHSGYVSGLEKLGDKIGFSSWKRTGIDYSPVYWFCREVAIATRNSNNCQSDPREDAYELINRGLLTKEERDYVYNQFGFNPDNFTPPPWMK